MTLHHTPACLLATATDLVFDATEQLRNILDALEDRVSEDVFDNVSRVIAVVELASDSLKQLTDEEHAAHPERQCHDSEECGTPAGEAN